MNPLISLAFMTGILGSAHCVGMCGGLVSALSLAANDHKCGTICQLLYHLGRVTTYSLIGFTVGWFGSAFSVKNALYKITGPLLIGSDIFIILIGLGSAGLFTKLNFGILKINSPLTTLNNMAGKLRELPTSVAAFPLGLLFGFIPCGMLYAMALTAAQSADKWTGGMMMAAFGLGTVPTLLLVGHTAQWFRKKRNWMLKAVGVMIALIGFYNLLTHVGWLK